MSAVFANLCQQLESYKNVGPPKISKVFTSLEDLDFAKKRRELDWEVSIDKKAIPENKVRLKDIETIHDYEVKVDDSKPEINSVVCGVGSSDEGKNVSSTLVM